MFGPMKLGVRALALALVVIPAMTAGAVSGQERFRVLIPDFFAMQDANRNFGRDVAKELREMVNAMPTHQPIVRDEIRDNLRRLDVDMEDLSCLTTRQFAPQVNAKVAICMTYVEQANDRIMSQIQIVNVEAGQVFPVPDLTINKDMKMEAARHIVSAFDMFIQQDRRRTFCYDYVRQELWDQALDNCTQAFDLNPDDNEVLYQRGWVLWQMERNAEALAVVLDVLETNPYHEDALNLAGFLAIAQGDREAGRAYYSRYLEVVPDAVDARRLIAYDMARAGDPEGAMAITEVGLETDPESVDLKSDIANYAFTAARNRLPEGFQPGPENPVPADVAEFYTRAIENYMAVFAVRGDSMDVSQLRNVVVANVQMNRLEDAVSMAEQVLEVFPDQTVIIATYADALRRLGRIDAAVAAYQRIESIDPAYPDLYARQGNILIQANRRDDALPILRRAVEQGGADPNRIARIIFADAHARGVTGENWDYAIAGLTAAKEYSGQVSSMTLSELNFWHGYALLQKGMVVQAPATVQSAQAAQPLFRQAKQMFGGATEYASSREGINLTAFNSNVDQYLEIQDAIIRRGGK